MNSWAGLICASWSHGQCLCPRKQTWRVPTSVDHGYSSQYFWNISKASFTVASYPASVCWAPASRLSPALVRWQSHGANYFSQTPGPGREIPGLLLLRHGLWKWLASVRNSGPYSCVDTCHILPLAFRCHVPSAWGGGTLFQLWIALLEPTQESKADLAHAEVLTHHLPLQRWRREEFSPGKMYVLSLSDQLQRKPPFNVCSVIVRQQHSQDCLDIAEQIHRENLIHRPFEKVLHHLAKLLTYHPSKSVFLLFTKMQV